MSFRFLVFSPRNNATWKNEKTKRRNNAMRKDEITPGEKTKECQAKRRNNATRKDKKTKKPTRKDDKLTVLNGVFSRGVFSSFRVAGFIISCFRVVLFRLFAWRYFVFSSFRVASFRLFVFSRGIILGRKYEMAQTSHHNHLYSETFLFFFFSLFLFAPEYCLRMTIGCSCFVFLCFV